MRCDAARVGAIFRNLITNALKYNDKPQKWIAIGCGDRGGSDDRQENCLAPQRAHLGGIHAWPRDHILLGIGCRPWPADISPFRW
jgi:signal transduction histidine kinase